MTDLVFDLNGTLLDPGPHADGIQAAVRLAMIRQLAGDFRPFDELLADAGATTPETMAPFPDVPGGLERLASAGHRLAVLTNSPRASAVQRLDGCGLLGHFDSVIGADDVGAYKPSERAYREGLAQLGWTADGTWLVAAHDWDIIGAHLCGMRTAFVDRGGPRPAGVPVDREVDAIDALAL